MRNSLAIGFIAAILLVSILSTIAGVQHRKTSGRDLQSDKSVALTNPSLPPIGEMKVLAEGSQSAIQEPFVALCRDDETYQALKKIDRGLPKLDKDFFELHAVIAAYLGTRNTGGYGVEITQKGDPNINFPSPDRMRFEVSERAPAKDAIVTQAITSPFIVVSLEATGAPPIILSLGPAWRQKQQLYRIQNATFSMGGGLSDIRETFEPQGEWLTLRARGLVSFYISMHATGERKERFLSDFATGILIKDDLTIKKLTASSFVDGPTSGLHATGTLKERDGKLSLHLSSLPSMVSDGYGGGGTIDAELVRPPSKQ